MLQYFFQMKYVFNGKEPGNILEIAILKNEMKLESILKCKKGKEN